MTPPRRNRVNAATGLSAVGCLWGLFVLAANVAWIAFLVWAIYTLVVWVTSK